MRVAVIGAGVAGVTTAYFLAQSGHQVTVIEQHGNVCEQASWGHAGLLGPGHLAPLAAPGMPGQIISHWFKSNGSPNLHPSLKFSQWRWLRSWMRECAIERMLANKSKMMRLGQYGQHVLADISASHLLDFQQRNGVLQLFRTAKELNNATSALSLLTEAGISFQQMDEAACRQCEPALNQHIPIAGGIYLPQDSQGNCVLFAKQLKNIAQRIGVEFTFQTVCERIISNHNGVMLHLNRDNQAIHQHYDLAVLAAGAQSTSLFNDIGITLRMATVQSYSNTANIKNIEDSPRFSVIDESAQITMTRMDKRVRVAGIFWSGKPNTKNDQHAWQQLRKTGAMWFPDAANYHSGVNWRGSHLMLPDNAPLLGKSAVNNVYLNLAHAEYGWAMAPGAAKVVADLISERRPEIDSDGLTLAR